MDNILAKQLIRAVKTSTNISYDDQNRLVSYINGVKNGTKVNGFIDDEILQNIVLSLANGDISLEGTDVISKWEELMDNVKFLLPEGSKTPGFESIKRSLLTGKHYNTEKSLYAILDNKIDYEQIMNIINSNKDVSDNSWAVFDYAVEVAPYCINQGVLKREIISFIKGLENEIGDVTGYSLKRLTEAKKRVGVYPLDESELAKISEGVRRMESYIRSAENYESSMKEREESAKRITASSIKEIGEAKANAIKDLKSAIETERLLMTKRLEEYLEVLKTNMKTSSDEAINLIIKDAQEKIRNLRIYAQDINNDTIKNLLQARNEAESSLQVIRDYIQNEPELRRIIADTAKSVAVKDAYLNGVVPSNTPSKVVEVPGIEAPSGPSIIIPGFDKQILPASQEVIIPEGKINSKLIEAFDTTIPFEKRIEKIMKEKEKRIKTGELFHEIIDQVIVDVIEGDWVYLYGPSGCGKTYIFEQVASLLGLDYAENGQINRVESVMAYTDPHGRFRATQAFISLLYGKLLSFDEFDSGDPECQVAVRVIYDEMKKVVDNPGKKRFVTFAETLTVPVNPNFRIIAAGNTTGDGENEVHNARNRIDEAIQQRLTPKKFNYDPRLEEKIFGKYKSWYELFKLFREACDSYAASQGYPATPGMVTTRDASSIVKYLNHKSKSIDWIINEKFIQKKDLDYLRSVSAYIHRTYPDLKYDMKNPNSSMDTISADAGVLIRSLDYRCNRPNN